MLRIKLSVYSTRTSIFHYSHYLQVLQKGNLSDSVFISTDLEHKPDIVWPNSEQITISSVSEGGAFMAMGLKNGTVVVWDVYRGESSNRLYELQGKKKIRTVFKLSVESNYAFASVLFYHIL